MLAAKGALAIAAAAMLTLAACGGEPRLMNLKSPGDGPDEFGILPPKALEMPQDLTSLPEPTLGGPNLTDQHPEIDVVVALGGRASAISPGVPASDGALVNNASRYGREIGIRQELAAEDLAFRQKNRARPLERLFKVTSYFRVYAPQSLDKQKELTRWRRAGVRSPSAPPAKDGK